MQAKLGNFAGIVAPMAASYKQLAIEYRSLRTESRELAATIAPAIKQAKRYGYCYLPCYPTSDEYKNSK